MADIPSFDDFRKQQATPAPSGTIPDFATFKAQQSAPPPVANPGAKTMPAQNPSGMDSTGNPAWYNFAGSLPGRLSDAYDGIKGIFTGNGADEKIGNASKAFRAGAGIASPLAIPALATAPIAGLTSAALGYGGSKLAGAGAKAFGAGPGVTSAAEDAGGLVGGLAGGMGGNKLADMVPNSARAGRNFQAVENAVGRNTPVDINKAYAPLIRAQELAGTGATAPKVVTSLNDRLTSAGASPLTYGESRDFASNAGNLAVQDKLNTNKMMGSQVKALAKALDEQNEAAANAAGVGDQYRSAMQEYRNASRLKEAGKLALKTGAGAALGYGVLSKGKEAARLLK